MCVLVFVAEAHHDKHSLLSGSLSLSFKRSTGKRQREELSCVCCKLAGRFAGDIISVGDEYDGRAEKNQSVVQGNT